MTAAHFASQLTASPKNIQRILVVRLQHHGDVLLITPLLNTLHEHYPDAQIDLLLYEGTQHILAAYPHCHHIHTIDRQLKRKGILAQIRGEKALFNTLQQAQYDLILNLSSQWRIAFYCRFLNPKISIAYNEPRRQNWLWKSSHTLLVDDPLWNEQHTVLHNLRILDPLELPSFNTTVTMRYTPEDAATVQQYCLEKAFDRYILIQPTARWGFKTWSPHLYAQLINHLTQCDHNIVLTGGPDPSEQAFIQSILNDCAHPHKILNLAGRLKFTELAALIDKALLYLGVDSAPMHMAAALQTPSVVLFGPSNLKQWYPWNTPHSLLWAGQYRQLPEVMEVDTNTPERYLDAIPVDVVIKEIERWLNPTKKEET